MNHVDIESNSNTDNLVQSCNGKNSFNVNVTKIPSVIVFSVQGDESNVNQKLFEALYVKKKVKYELFSLLYYNGNHFCSKIFMDGGAIFYDGMNNPCLSWCEVDYNPSKDYRINQVWYVKSILVHDNMHERDNTEELFKHTISLSSSESCTSSKKNKYDTIDSDSSKSSSSSKRNVLLPDIKFKKKDNRSGYISTSMKKVRRRPQPKKYIPMVFRLAPCRTSE